ncbi:hypothetical protein M569_16679 [Genlisea aurea]|uniref:At4g15545-like C-terminal domain-containing protein n=1 Tax=Genlisea aurea TaxID=192259 RepID=S8C103_9LAMI|nr:hypothetical protein M569_16679 [Genlisea aurea]
MFDLPEELLEVLPSDPFDQLDIARKITSIALSARINALESEISQLRQQLSERDGFISHLESQLESLDASVIDAEDKLAAAQQEKENLTRENEQLSSAVKKLNRDVAKLEIFRKTLMKSLQEDEDSQVSVTNYSSASRLIANNDDDVSNQAQLPPEDSETTEVTRPRVSHGLLLASQTSTPRLTPTGSPPNESASISPSRSRMPVSPRRHSMTISTARGFFDDRSSGVSSAPSSQFSSMSSFEAGSEPGKTRVSGKEFFRQVRTKLSYEQFGAFLSNVKELNSHKQSKQETLRKADEIFGPENKDLYTIFEGLILRNLQ